MTDRSIDPEKYRVATLVMLRLAHVYKVVPIRSCEPSDREIELGYNNQSIWLSFRGESVARLEWARWLTGDLETLLAQAVWITDRLLCQWKGRPAC